MIKLEEAVMSLMQDLEKRRSGRGVELGGDRAPVLGRESPSVIYFRSKRRGND